MKYAYKIDIKIIKNNDLYNIYLQNKLLVLYFRKRDKTINQNTMKKRLK